MPTFETTRRVPFTAEQMFAVVADVERYPEFVPLCEKLIVHERKQTGPDAELIASMSVGYKAIRETYKSRVTLRPAAREIDVAKIDGPFAHLTNRWRFRDVPGGSEIYFHVDYAFASRMLAVLMGAVFDKAVRKYTEAFEARARALYGAGATVAPNPLADCLVDVACGGEPQRRIEAARTGEDGAVEIGFGQVDAGEVGTGQIGA